ncbi:hypothetical protein ACFLTG_02825, partial [Chloroflexota bacterium]
MCHSKEDKVIDGELIVGYVRTRLKVRRGREMKFKDLFGRDKEPKVKVEAETKIEPAVEVEAETKIEPAVEVEAET